MKKLAFAACLLAGLVAAGFLSAPSVAKWYVERNYQGVTVRSVDIAWLDRTAELHDVVVHREGLDATLKSVTVTEDQVHADEGSVKLILGSGARASTPGSGGRMLTGAGLNVSLTMGDIEVETVNTGFNPWEVCFETAVVRHPKVAATVEQGCVARDRSHVNARLVKTLPVKLPFAVPEVSEEVTATVFWLDANLREKTAKAHSVVIQEFPEVEEGATLFVAEEVDALLGEALFSAGADRLRISHDWVCNWGEIEPVAITVPMSVLRERQGEVEVQLGEAHVSVDPFAKSVRGEEPCGAWASAMPSPPSVVVEAAKHLTGKLGFRVTTSPVSFKLDASCKFRCSESPIKEIKASKFAYSVYTPEGTWVRRETGRGTPTWTSLQDLPPHIPEAFILLEDPGFRSHRGVLPLALENSLKINLEEGRFARGGSTITMQLAKNLWLYRDKTITRKAEEALLTYALESCLSKAEILELYLNVVEYGPNVYGISEGSKYRFKKPPMALTPEEAFYLASILPAPRKALAPEAGGLDRAKRIMKMLAKSGFISELMIEDDTPIDTTGWDLAP